MLICSHERQAPLVYLGIVAICKIGRAGACHAAVAIAGFSVRLIVSCSLWSHFRRKQGDPNASLSSLIPDISKVIIMFHTTFVFCVLISE
jgi:hypothetical protein